MNERSDQHRLIVAEITSQSRLPITKFPANDHYLPTDLSYSQNHDAEAASVPQSNVLLGSFHSSDISGFGRQSQAASMLDEVLHILGSTEASPVKGKYVSRQQRQGRLVQSLNIPDHDRICTALTTRNSILVHDKGQERTKLLI